MTTDNLIELEHRKQALQNWAVELRKLATANKSFALSIHSDFRTKILPLRRNHSSLHRRILTSHVFVYCVKRRLHKRSLVLRHIGHNQWRCWRETRMRTTTTLEIWIKEPGPHLAYMSVLPFFCFSGVCCFVAFFGSF